MLYCPSCGDRAFARESEKSHRCSSCQFVLYRNASAAVSAIIVRGPEVLMTVRAREPAQGKLDLPGGFVDHEETAEQALEREAREELGLSLRAYKYFCSFPNVYPFGGISYHVLDLFYLVEAKDLDLGPMVIDGDEIAGYRWIDVDSISFEELAFASTKMALERYRGMR